MRHRFTQFNRIDRRKAVVASVACLAVLALALYGFLGKSANQKVKTGGGKPLVKVVTVTRADMMRHIALSGQTVANANIPLAPKYTGRVTEVRAKLGDTVEAGDVLIRAQPVPLLDRGHLAGHARQGQAGVSGFKSDF